MNNVELLGLENSYYWPFSVSVDKWQHIVVFAGKKMKKLNSSLIQTEVKLN